MQRVTASRTPHLGLARRSLNALIRGASPEGHGSTRARILPRARRILTSSCAVPSTAGAVVGHGLCTAGAVIGGRAIAGKISMRNGKHVQFLFLDVMLTRDSHAWWSDCVPRFRYHLHIRSVLLILSKMHTSSIARRVWRVGYRPLGLRSNYLYLILTHLCNINCT